MTLASLMILARILTPEEFGIVATLTPLIAFTQLLKNFGIASTIIQSNRLTHGEVSTYFWLQILLGLLLGVLLAALGPIWARLFEDPRMVSLAFAMGFIVFLEVVGGVHNALLRRNLLFGRVTLIEFLAQVGALIGALTAAVLGWGYWALVCKSGLLAVISVAGGWIACSWRPGFYWLDRSAFSGLLFGGSLTFGNFCDYIRRNVDIVLVRGAAGVDTLGHYSRAYGLVMMPMTFIMGPINAVTLPLLSRKQEDPDYLDTFIHVLRASVALAVPPGMFALFFPAAVVRVGLGEQWVEAIAFLEALGLVAVLLPIGTCLSLNIIVFRKTIVVMTVVPLNLLIALIAYFVGIQESALQLAVYYSYAVVIMIGIYGVAVAKSIGLPMGRVTLSVLPLFAGMGFAVLATKLLESQFPVTTMPTMFNSIALMAFYSCFYAVCVLWGLGYWKQLMQLRGLANSGGSSESQEG